LISNVNAEIEVAHLSKSLRGRLILDSVDLFVPKGAVAVVEGENGSGKTTLVRILSTVISPDSGIVLVNGHEVKKDPLAVRRSIGVSYANERSLYWRITGYQNLELFGRIGGVPKHVIRRRSVRICESLSIANVAFERVARMSTGQRQRLMIARAMLSNPPILLLDEPYRGLDAEGLEALCSTVSDRKSNGLTTLIVAPVIDPILAIADESYRIEGGQLSRIFTGPTNVPKL
jgi:ABC-2 type transport system ATP-binding protein